MRWSDPPSPTPTVRCTVSTPYPSIETQPGSTVKLDVDVASTPTSSGRPRRRRRFPTAGRRRCAAAASSSTRSRRQPATPAQGDARDRRPARRRRRRVPDDRHRHRRRRRRRRSTVTLDVAAGGRQRDPAHRRLPVAAAAIPATAFTYNLTITNNTPEQQTFTFDPTAPQGWTVTASPTRRGQGPDGHDRRRRDSTVKVTRRRRHGAPRAATRSTSTVAAANGATGQDRARRPRSPARRSWRSGPPTSGSTSRARPTPRSGCR